MDYAPLLPDGPAKFFAVVLIGHLAWGYFEYTRVRNFYNKGQVRFAYSSLLSQANYTPFLSILGLVDNVATKGALYHFI